MRSNMMQYDAEGYGWQNIIDSPDGLAPQPGAWLLGALRMVCEPQPAAVVTGTVTYRQRIALPPDATVVVTLEDVSLADAPSTVVGGDMIRTAGLQVPIPFSITYDPAEIIPQHRYVVRAKIFYGEDLSWTSTTAYPVITQDSPTEDVEITVQQI
ncbi:YbaY family lipoprotein [Halomicronema sp. CCY15110]|uniref:YbaY family lipoprotein n=1 Tax=Halomicronema sp. CCY15110 TaxID=2767773 RepID=UPI00195065A3|nr:YbaY family lipoprotein [Halomicronema sp. CCY15110]